MAATVGYVAAGAPLPVVPTLRGDDGVDGTTVSYLLKVALQKKEEEEERRRKLEEKEEEEDKKEGMLELSRKDRTPSPFRPLQKRMKRKKRRKKKTSQTSAHSSRGRALLRLSAGPSCLASWSLFLLVRRRPCERQRQVPAVHDADCAENRLVSAGAVLGQGSLTCRSRCNDRCCGPGQCAENWIFWETIWYFFYGPLYLAEVSAFSTFLGSTVDTCPCESTGRFGKNHTFSS